MKQMKTSSDPGPSFFSGPGPGLAPYFLRNLHAGPKRPKRPALAVTCDEERPALGVFVLDEVEKGTANVLVGHLHGL